MPRYEELLADKIDREDVDLVCKCCDRFTNELTFEDFCLSCDREIKEYTEK